MLEKMELADILDRNKKIRPEDLKRNRRLFEEMRKFGLHRRQYSLADPSARRRVSSQQEDTDPRTICLDQSKH